MSLDSNIRQINEKAFKGQNFFLYLFSIIQILLLIKVLG